MRSVEETVRRAQKGDANAFGDLIAQFERTALAVAYGVLGDGERSGDAVQEAFVRLAATDRTRADHGEP